MKAQLIRYLPCLRWARRYDVALAGRDGMAALIVTLMLVPQSLAYALLAGLPPAAGLYASILPLIAYALFGTSNDLAVGPVAVTSLMTAAALGPLFPAGSAEYAGGAVLLALLVGIMLLLMAIARLGFLANFLSHPVISGFITGSGLLIALSQTGHLLGTGAGGYNGIELVLALQDEWRAVHLPTLIVGVSTLVFLWLMRTRGGGWLKACGLSSALAGTLVRTAPAIAVIVAIVAVAQLGLAADGMRVVGEVAAGLPPIALPTVDWSLARQLLPAALLITLVGFVESISVAQTLAARQRLHVDPDQELVALGSANVAAAFSAGLPVTGGFARSVVNADAGAQTPMAGLLTALAVAVTLLFFAPLLHDLPHAVLAATIIVAVLRLVDFGALRRIWRYSKHDGVAMAATMLGVLLLGVEAGILVGGGLSLLLFLWRTSKPHIAVLGQLPGSEHFRNVERYAAVESPTVLSVRIDESLYFPNARYLEDSIARLVARHPQAEHLVLMCSGVNLIDASALESLEAITERLRTAGVQLHFSEIKGPVMDRLRNSTFLDRFGGRIFISQFEALKALDAETTERTLALSKNFPCEANARPGARER